MVRKNNTALFIIIIFVLFTGCESQNHKLKYTSEKDFYFETLEDGSIIIKGYLGQSSDVRIPPVIDGLPVTVIGYGAFLEKNINSVTIPDSVIRIDSGAFYHNYEGIPLSKVTIGDNVMLDDPFQQAPLQGFTGFYNFGVRGKGGTYYIQDNHWTPEDKTTPIYSFDSWWWRDADFTGNSLTNLDFLADMPLIERVSLSHCFQLKDISGLRNLENLRNIFIEICPNIETLEPLSNLSNLETLHLKINRMDASHIYRIHSLKNLTINLDNFGNSSEDVVIENIELLQHMANLENLVLTGVNNLDISWIASAQSLKTIELYGNYFEDITPLAEAPNLIKVTLSGNQIKDPRQLLESTSIKEININVYDFDFKGWEAAVDLNALRDSFRQRGIDFVINWPGP